MLTATAPPASFGLSLTEPAGACAASAASQAIAVLLDRRNNDFSISDSSSCSPYMKRAWFERVLSWIVRVGGGVFHAQPEERFLNYSQ